MFEQDAGRQGPHAEHLNRLTDRSFSGNWLYQWCWAGVWNRLSWGFSGLSDRERPLFASRVVDELPPAVGSETSPSTAALAQEDRVDNELSSLPSKESK